MTGLGGSTHQSLRFRSQLSSAQKFVVESHKSPESVVAGQPANDSRIRSLLKLDLTERVRVGLGQGNRRNQSKTRVFRAPIA
jgi:hypothetical protein